jgi:hypothetical protein
MEEAAPINPKIKTRGVTMDTKLIIAALESCEANREEVYKVINDLIALDEEELRLVYDHQKNRDQRILATQQAKTAESEQRASLILKRQAFLGMIKNKLAGKEPVHLSIQTLVPGNVVAFEDPPKKRLFGREKK